MQAPVSSLASSPPPKHREGISHRARGPGDRYRGSRRRAQAPYSKCIMRKRGEDISILSDKVWKIISDPYSRYESQDTGIYNTINILGPTEFR